MKRSRQYLIFGIFCLLNSGKTFSNDFDKEKTNELKNYLNELVKAYNQTEKKPDKTELDHVVKKLVTQNADPNTRTDKKLNGTVPMHFAAESGDVNLIDFLFEHGASIDAGSEIYGSTPLMIAIKNGHENAVYKLIELKANIETKNNKCATALLCAAFWGHEKVIKKLIDLKAHIETEDYKKMTPLMYAAKENHIGAVVMLLRSGANTETCDAYGWAILHYAFGESEKLLRAYLLKGHSLRHEIIETVLCVWKVFHGKLPISKDILYLIVKAIFLSNGLSLELYDVPFIIVKFLA